MKSGAKAVLVLISLVIAGLLAVAITKPWFAGLQSQTACRGPNHTLLSRDLSPRALFVECLEQKAKLFLEKDYAESKDLAKTFLTLLSAILVGSITFSEKIVDIHNSKRAPLLAMIVCWLLLMLAIVFTGSGLASMALGAGYAAYYPDADYWAFESHAVLLFIGACFAFGVAMLSLILAGVISLTDKRASALAPAVHAASNANPRVEADGSVELATDHD